MASKTLDRERTRTMSRSHSAPTTAGERSDAELLYAIAEEKDHAAFSALFERYETPCYNLALRITANREAALEAVQDALLRIWTSAGTFDPAGNARGWILQTLARCCLRNLKKRAAERRREEQTVNESSTGAPPQERLAHDEITRALHNAIDALPEFERRLVALYYGCDLSQEEIGREMAIPQRTVSGRLERVLTGLRRTLEQGGYAAAVPLLGSGLDDVLATGHAAPAALKAAVTATVLKGGAEQSVRLAAAKGLSVPQTLGIVALIAAAGSGILYVSVQSAQQRPAVAPTSSLEKKTPELAEAVAKNEPPAPLHRRWTFENGEPADLKADSSWWDFVPAQGKRPAYMSAGFEVWVRLPDPAPKRPLVGTFHLCVEPGSKGPVEFGINWSKGRSLLPRTNYSPTVNKPTFHSLTPVMRIYVWDHYVVATDGKGIISLTEFDAAYPSEGLHFSLGSVGLEKLELDEIAESEIPAFVRDIEGMKARYKMTSHRKRELHLRPPGREHATEPAMEGAE
ncbi:MAG: sigma-70 family RNA polymerase sigma factor [Planctomycetes bacterium]|nr:sigma-70 family RNA polymerase sigma factor [Planctomycetota bacterium]